MLTCRHLPVLLTLLVACAPGSGTRGTGSDAEFRRELLTRVGRDQAVRDSFAAELRATGTVSPGVAVAMRAVDSVNLAWLKPRLRSAGFPTRAEVGAEGVAAAALLVQHADQDPAFQAEMLPMLEAARQVGDVTGQEVAMLTDRVAKAQGRPQRYGTQTTIRNGRAVIDPIKDSAGVDRRRAEMGLPPLAEYQELLDSVYAQRPAP